MKLQSKRNFTRQTETPSMEELMERGRSLHSQAVFSAIEKSIKFFLKGDVNTERTFSKCDNLKAPLKPANP